MKLLERPEVRYGLLPTRSIVERELKAQKQLQTSEGAMKYLELHLNRVEECFAELSRGEHSIWAFLARKKAAANFTNTTRALRVIIKYHENDLELLSEMHRRVLAKAEVGDALEPHYRYLITLLDELLIKLK